MLADINVINILDTWRVKLILHVTDIYVEQYGTQHGALRYTKIDFFVTRFITVDLNVLLSITDVAKNKMQEFW